MGVRDRLARLERNMPGECPGCSKRRLVIVVNGTVVGHRRDDSEMREEEYRDYEGQWGPRGECPECGREPFEIKIGGPDHFQGKDRHGRPLRSV